MNTLVSITTFFIPPHRLDRLDHGSEEVMREILPIGVRRLPGDGGSGSLDDVAALADLPEPKNLSESAVDRVFASLEK